MTSTSRIGELSDSWYIAVGKLVSNLQSLEAQARWALLVNHSIHNVEEWYRYLDKIKGMKEGESIEEDEFTNYATLGETVREFNAISSKKLDEGLVVGTRDLLAHGRVGAVWVDEKDTTARIFWFTRPTKEKHVTVKVKEVLSEEWLTARADLIFAQTQITMEKLMEVLAKVPGMPPI
jgi:hypothetical protein